MLSSGLLLKSHDPSQRANRFLILEGGVVMTFAKEILTLITGYGKRQIIELFQELRYGHALGMLHIQT